MAKPTQLTSAFDLFSKSADVVMNNFKVFGWIFLLPLLTSLASSINYGEHFDGNKWSELNFSFGGLPTYAVVGLVGFGIVFFVALLIVGMLVQTMRTVAELEGAQGKKLQLNQVFALGRKYILRLLGFYILYGLMIIGGLLLLVVPGLIVVRRYVLAPYIMIDKDLGIKEAMRQSSKMTKPYSKSIWAIIGVMLLLSLPAIIPVIGSLISFVLNALYTVAFALRYQELKHIR